MATVDPKYGHDYVLKVGSTSTTDQIDNLLTNGISRSRDTRDVTTKNSTGNWREFKVTYKNAEIQFEGIYTEDATGIVSFGVLEGYWDDAIEIYWEYGSGVTGSRKETGRGYIISLERNDGQDDNSGFSGTIKVTGDVTVGVYA
jgi:predicted secreted protein